MCKLMTEASRNNREKTVELPGWVPEDWVELGSCLAKTYSLYGLMCGGLDCGKQFQQTA